MGKVCAGVVFSIVLVAGGFARADGLSTGWNTNCWSSTNDADADGLNDTCERDLAYWFAAWYWYDDGEDTSGWRPYYAARSYNYSTKTVRMMFLHTYYRDGGDIGGLTSHDGDPEFVVMEASYNTGTGRWYLDWVYMSAHRNQLGDHSAWYYYTQVEYGAGPYRGYPTVYAAENKHASYKSDSDCDNGGILWSDNCDRDWGRWIFNSTTEMSGRNVGSRAHELVNYVALFGDYEYLMDPVAFCGWQRAGNSSTSSCSNGYDVHLNDFGF